MALCLLYIKSYPVGKQINGDRIISLFGFSRYIDFAMHLDMIYIYMHSKNYASRKAKKHD